ncbi:MAG: glycosyltransferase family 4 protein [Deltaproteobacteria bacterium]|nr:glycosyltransferase family 4 protein [Deltaproteobacteria bacterium]
MTASIARTGEALERATSPAPLPSAVLTHHWLVRPRGGEKVLEALSELVPDAEIYTLVYDAAGMGDSPLTRRRVHTSVLQRLPGGTRHYPRLLPVLPWAARRMRLPDVDLVVCSDASVAKAMQASERSTVVCYCHSPMRYAYEAALHREYRDTLPLPVRPFWGLVTAAARSIDRRAARRVDLFVANSAHVARRIERVYGRRAVVVFPPVDVPAAPVIGTRDDFYLCIGYHTRYKRLDLAVEACRRLGRRLVAIGTGPEVDRLRLRRAPNVEVLDWQPDAVVHEHLARARGLLFPGEEDFGIVPVEAFSRGCPVAAYAIGGATETVEPGVTGVWFERQSADDLVAAMRRLEATEFDPEAMHRSAQRFARDRFLAEMREVLAGALAGRLRS